MELIKSFSVDHTAIVPGIFVSRDDQVGGDVVTTYDIRLKRPNREPVIDVGAMHSLEHIIATVLRNDPEWKDQIIYWGPMGCLTGFYLILKGDRPSKEIYGLILNAFKAVKDAKDVPGATPNITGSLAGKEKEDPRTPKEKALEEKLMATYQENKKAKDEEKALQKVERDHKRNESKKRIAENIQKIKERFRKRKDEDPEP